MLVKKPHIAIIGAKGLPAFGGSARSIETLLPHLAEHYIITIYMIKTKCGDFILPKDVKSILIQTPSIKRLDTLWYYLWSMFHCLINGTYDLVFVQHIYSGFIIPLLKIKYKVVLVVRGIIPKDDMKWSSMDKWIFRLVEKLVVNFPDVLVNVSKPQNEYLRKITKSKIVNIPNGVKIEDFKNIEAVRNENTIVFSAARIIPLKGCHTLMEALLKIQNPIKLVIIGDMNQIPSYKSHILSLSKTLNVEFKGLIKSKSELLFTISAGSVFVFPSLIEGLSNMLLEVAALGVPIIASDIPENTSIFDSTEVLFFKSGDVNDLSEKINYAMQNYSVIKEHAILAREKVFAHYGSQTVADQYKRIFDVLLRS